MRSIRGFTTKRVREKRDSDFSFSSERREKTRLCGFTLVEAMVAVTVLTLAISGAFFTANSAITAAEIARDQLTASYLAQEGIEHVRKMRDDAYLAAYALEDTTSAWSAFLANIDQCDATEDSTRACTLDPTNGLSIQSCSVESCAPLYLSGGLYRQSGNEGEQHVFTRTIQAFAVSANDERIVSRVSWSFHSTIYSVTVTDHLTPWQ